MGSMQKTWKAQENTKLGGWIKLPKQREREKGTQTEADKQDTELPQRPSSLLGVRSCPGL